MRPRLARIAGILAVVLVSLSSAYGGEPQGANPTVEPQYLTFQIFTAGPGMTTVPGQHIFSKLPPRGFLAGEAAQIVGAIGARGDAGHRLGIIIGPLALDYTDDQMRALIARTFAIAEKYRIAVGLHIDDAKFWVNRRDLWSNPANVEWLDWNRTPNTGQYLNWGEPWKLAPQACFNSPAMLSEARRVAGQVIGPAIAEQLAKLRRRGDAALFAGVIVGWETAIGRDYDTRRNLGYCALTNLGFSKSAPPRDPDRVLEGVVGNWIATWSKSLEAAGVPSDKVYSHIGFKSRRQFAGSHAPNGVSYAESVMYSPPSVAFGKYYRPGFTTYPDADILGEIYAALQAHGNPPWASSEGTDVDIQTWPFRIPKDGMEEYLARMFDHGATLANVFGWDIGDRGNLFRRATESAPAIAAYRKFLGGARLEEKPLAQSDRGLSAVQKLMRALPALIERYVHSGGDLQLIRPHVERLEQDMKNGRLAAMKQELEQILATIGGSDR